MLGMHAIPSLSFPSSSSIADEICTITQLRAALRWKKKLRLKGRPACVASAVKQNLPPKALRDSKKSQMLLAAMTSRVCSDTTRSLTMLAKLTILILDSSSVQPSTPRASTNSNAQSPPTSTAAPNTPTNSHAQPTEADIRALLHASAPDPSTQDQEAQQIEEDPMLKMMSQLMEGIQPGSTSADASPDGLPPGLAALMGPVAGNAGAGAARTPAQQSAATFDYAWKIVHAFFAFALGLYAVATSTSFTKSLVRVPGKPNEHDIYQRDGINLFWAFATVELVLQSTRYFLERGRTGSGIGGMMGTASAVLPEPWASYLRLVARYSGIWSTIVGQSCLSLS